MKKMYTFIGVSLFVIRIVTGMKIEGLNCGMDDEADIHIGEVPIRTYPWVGIYYYIYDDMGEARATTTVAVIHTEFVIGIAADIGSIPKHDFRVNSRVLIGEDWIAGGRRVRNYVLHPEYGETQNTLALLHLRDKITRDKIPPLCPTPRFLKDPKFYLVKFNEDYNKLVKTVIPMSHIPGALCKDFYVAANLYTKRMRPPHVVCAAATDTDQPCVWEGGGVLVTRDSWGRWQLLGVLTRGPGCGAPSRYLDMMSYYPWVEDAVAKFQHITITKLDKQRYVLRSSESAVTRFGYCDAEEKQHLLYRDLFLLETDLITKQLGQIKTVRYNLTLKEDVELTCITLELVNASADSQMAVTHHCPRTTYGPPCYWYKGGQFRMFVKMEFTEDCFFELYVWGHFKEMQLINVLEWHWEEGTYYKDFLPERDEYKGQMDMTGIGYEPLDKKNWYPEFDVWTTTTIIAFGEAGYKVTPPTTEIPLKEGFLDYDIKTPFVKYPHEWMTKPPWPYRKTRKTTIKTKAPPAAQTTTKTHTAWAWTTQKYGRLVVHTSVPLFTHTPPRDKDGRQPLPPFDPDDDKNAFLTG